MGNAFSLFIHSTQSMKQDLIYKLDDIARDVIFKAKLTELIKLRDPAYCNKMIVVTSRLGRGIFAWTPLPAPQQGDIEDYETLGRNLPLEKLVS